MSWLSSLQDWFASTANGNGLMIALVLAALSAAIGIAVAVNWPAAAIPRARGRAEPRSTGSSARASAVSSRAARPIPNAGPLFVLLAFALYSLIPTAVPGASPSRRSD